MRIIVIVILSLLSSLFTFLFSQDGRCSINEVEQFIRDVYPEYEITNQEYSERMFQYLSESQRNKKQNEPGSSVARIPVVVHLISDEVIDHCQSLSFQNVFDQIRVLNEDFRRKANTNGYGSGVDTEIEFCLAAKKPNGDSFPGWTLNPDPDGSPYPVWNSSIDQQLKSVIHWNPDRYLNLYVVKMGMGNLGYAYKPSIMVDHPELDGVVINHINFGDLSDPEYGLGRTTTHEVGHWFGLCHTFGCNARDYSCSDDDGIYDTPVCQGSRSSGTYPNCNKDIQCQTENDLNGTTSARQIENYMDYSHDYCMNMFTQGQKDLMWQNINFGQRGVIVFAPSVASCPTPEHCNNGVRDYDELDVDCGSSCPPCLPGYGPAEGTYCLNPETSDKMHNITLKINGQTNDINYVCEGSRIRLGFSKCPVNGDGNYKWLGLSEMDIDGNILKDDFMTYTNDTRDDYHYAIGNLYNLASSLNFDLRPGYVYKIKDARVYNGNWSEANTYFLIYPNELNFNWWTDTSRFHAARGIYLKDGAMIESEEMVYEAQDFIEMQPGSELRPGESFDLKIDREAACSIYSSKTSDELSYHVPTNGYEDIVMEEQAFEPDSKVEVYPTIADNRLVYVSLPDRLVTSKYSIFNSIGSILKEGFFSSNFNVVNLDYYEAGTYLILIDHKPYKIIVP